MWLHVYHIVPNPHYNVENFSAQFYACVQEICTATFIKHNGMIQLLRENSILYAIGNFTRNFNKFPIFMVVL